MARSRRKRNPNHPQPRPQVRPRCWFCDTEGVSDEHIFARSFAKLFPPGGRLINGYEGPDGRRSEIRAKTFTYKTRRFCESCNNGWMNEADDTVRPLLAAFAADTPLELSPESQRDLALWTVKTLFGFLSRATEGYRFADSSLYRELYETRLPPSGTQLWVGANNHGDIGWSGSHSLTFEALPEQTKGFGGTISFGHGVLHLIYHGRPDHRLRLRYDAYRALRQIWPSQPEAVSWPPPLRMTPRDLTPLAETINANSVWAAR
jgi:hypothetical protein